MSLYNLDFPTSLDVVFPYSDGTSETLTEFLNYLLFFVSGASAETQTSLNTKLTSFSIYPTFFGSIVLSGSVFNITTQGVGYYLVYVPSPISGTVSFSINSIVSPVYSRQSNLPVTLQNLPPQLYTFFWDGANLRIDTERLSTCYYLGEVSLNDPFLNQDMEGTGFPCGGDVQSRYSPNISSHRHTLPNSKNISTRTIQVLPNSSGVFVDVLQDAITKSQDSSVPYVVPNNIKSLLKYRGI
jgi:hypothetical protein